MHETVSVLELALNLTEALNSTDRYQKLLKTITNSLPCDAASLMIKQGQFLETVASLGLVEHVVNKQFYIGDHPRLKIIVNSLGPVIFPHNSPLPDPFDGIVSHKDPNLFHIHSCLGCPLVVEGNIIGVLTVDALEPHKFDDIEREWLRTIAALAGATLRTSKLIEQIEMLVKREQNFSQNLVADVNKEKNSDLIGDSQGIQKVKEHIQIVAPSNLSILITGETGVGKEIVARLVHKNSSRSTMPLIYVNCAALSESLIESELFGHIKGSFTGAISDRMGKFQLANNGTLFLDEIGELPLTVQAKLLRVLQEGEVQKVGADNVSKVNVRIIAATNRNLEVEKDEGRFRADLFHRLSVYPINVLPLRERKDDIPKLVQYFSKQFQRKLGTLEVFLNDESLQLLVNYPWPGNVRELKNILGRAILTAKNRSSNYRETHLLLIKDDFALVSEEKVNSKNNVTKIELGEDPEENLSLNEATQNFQRVFIKKKLTENSENWAQTAKILGLHRSNLHHLGKKLGLK